LTYPFLNLLAVVKGFDFLADFFKDMSKPQPNYQCH